MQEAGRCYQSGFKPVQGENLWPEEIQRSLAYREVLPGRELQPYVACFWAVTSHKPLKESVIDRIIPDGCIDLVFNMDDLALGRGGSVVGVMTEPEIKEIRGSRNFVGVRFWPGGIIPFLRIPAAEFTDESVALEDIWGSESGIISEGVYLRESPLEKIEYLAGALQRRLKNVEEADDLVKSALQKVLVSRGTIAVNQLARELDISQRHLSRKFKDWVGISPKRFGSIIRFQNIVQEINSSINEQGELDWINIALKNGYYDQAHLIREFKKLYGKTPGHLF